MNELTWGGAWSLGWRFIGRGTLVQLLILVLVGIAAPIGAYAGPYIGDIGNPSGSTRVRHALSIGALFAGVGAGIGLLTGAERTVFRAR